jgi:hypothetical protein
LLPAFAKTKKKTIIRRLKMDKEKQVNEKLQCKNCYFSEAFESPILNGCVYCNFLQKTVAEDHCCKYINERN